MRKRKNNKGFSLIELVVVITIMAALVGLLAPAYTRYIEKTRRQTCYWNMDNVVREVQLKAFSEPGFLDDLLALTDDEILDYVREETDIHVPTCPSRGIYSLTYNETTGELVMSCTMTVHNLPVEGEGIR